MNRYDIDFTLHYSAVQAPQDLKAPLGHSQMFSGESLRVIDLNDKKDLLKNSGLFGGWAKELSGTNRAAFGGAALVGEWLHVAKDVLVTGDKFYKITFSCSDLDRYKYSPVVMSASIDSTTVTALFYKDSSQPNQFQSGLITSLHIELPVPINLAYSQHQKYQTDFKRKGVSPFSPSTVGALVDVAVQCSGDCRIAAVVISNGSKIQRILVDPGRNHPSLLNRMSSANGANQAVDEMLFQDVDDGKILFDDVQHTHTVRSRKSRSAFADMQVDAKEKAKIVEKERLWDVKVKTPELPDLPNGCEWYSNLFGIILIKRQDGSVVPPSVVFTLMDIDARIRKYEADGDMVLVENERRQFVLVKGVLDQMVETANMLKLMAESSLFV